MKPSFSLTPKSKEIHFQDAPKLEISTLPTRTRVKSLSHYNAALSK
jgi:hypothetical protein